MTNKPLEIYLHIPFCVRKCAYCDFLSGSANGETMLRYTAALCQEIQLRKSEYQGRRISSIFFGGGTPSALPLGCIELLLKTITGRMELSPDCEITLEMNPGTAVKEKLAEYKKAGVNRLSIGLQSTNDEELCTLGRIHTYRQFQDTYETAREVGFANINVDLISAVPGQTKASFLDSLRKITQLTKPPEHISVYSLIIEEGTPFYQLYQDKPALFLSEEEDRDLYHETKALLNTFGYDRYEISNYAKPGFACRHNMGYWNRAEYLGFGIGAASLYKESRFFNSDILEDYLENPVGVRSTPEVLSKKDQMSEFMFLGLRLCKGVSKSEFQRIFGTSIRNVFEEAISKSIREKLMLETRDSFMLTDYGLDVSNYVMSRFLL